jgi:import inner membrane translocase subunit TIM17
MPFPDCIPIIAGARFIAGGACGSVFHFLNALHNSTSGRRVAGSVQAVRANAPRLAGTWTALSLAFCAVDSAMYYARRKEDPWNHMVACACARGLHHRRKGLKVAVRSALVGAVCWGLAEVSLIGMENLTADPHRRSRLPAACSDGDPARPPPPPEISVLEKVPV